MQVKFETKSQRVKGMCFHPIRPWVLSSLHNGVIQLWDYRVGSLIDKFEEHEGPVRGIDFHPSQPLFVSGGDDYKIKVWSYKQRKCLFTLKGHLDYIRTVFFHNELPWILSASDDQTIRIWNWQNRGLMAILTGHSHYVMCAQFHPSKDLIVSCSLDQTLRLWDYTAIRKKVMKNSSYSGNQGGQQRAQEIYGNEVEIIAVMEGHDRGVNWCSFHPTLNLIASAADDRKVKLWKYTENKAWEHDSLYGHTSNVSSCVFHPKMDIIISNSEDKTTRIWDLMRRTQIDMFRRETDRFWICAVHQDNLFFGTGCDSGFYVLSLLRQNFPVELIDNGSIPQQQAVNLVIGYRRQFKLFNLQSKQEQIIKTIDAAISSGSSGQSSLLTDNITSLTYNSFDSGATKHSFLLATEDKDRNQNKFYLLQYESSNAGGFSNMENALKPAKEQCKTFQARAAVFISKNKIVRLKDTKELEVYNFELEGSGSHAITGLPPVENVFAGSIGKVILSTEDQIILYDINGKKIIAQINATADFANLKFISWSRSGQFVALVCKKNIHIMTKNLNKICTVAEKFNVKSLCWNKDGLFIYSTINHIKYGLLNGESGIIRCIDQLYLVIRLIGNELDVVDSSGKVITFNVESDEFMLKFALYEKNWAQTQYYMNTMKRLGNSIVAYLYKKNYAALALNLVDDKKAKFSLAIDSGNLEVAYKTCFELKDKELIKQLADEANRQGNHQLVEIALQQIRDYDKLNFLYTVLGKMDKLEKMLQIAQTRNDNMSRFQIALVLGDVQERIRILAEIGQIHLAFLTSVTHGYLDMARPLQESIENYKEDLEFIKGLKCSAMVPARPLVKDAELSPQVKRNWPHNYLPEDTIITSSKANPVEEIKKPEDTLIDDTNDNLISSKPNVGNKDQVSGDQNTNKIDLAVNDIDGEGGKDWGIEDEIEIPETVPEQQDEQQQTQIQQPQVASIQDLYKKGENLIIKQAKLSTSASDHIAIGFFDQAFNLLKKQLGIYNFEPLKTIATQIALNTYTTVSNIPFVSPQCSLFTNISAQMAQNNVNILKRPYNIKSLASLENPLKLAYKFTTEGKFQESVNQFLNVLWSIPFLIISRDEEEKDILSLIKICLEYIIAMRCELQKKIEPNRLLELTCYMSLCNLQAPHRVLTLRSAMSASYKSNNFIFANFFAKKLIRVLELTPNAAKPEVLSNAKKMQQACEQQGTNALKLEFDEAWLYDDEFVYKINPNNFKLNLNTKDIVKCPFCQAKYPKDREDKICDICNIAKIGVQVLGFKRQ